MEKLAVGDVVVIPFPYADFSRLKKRPALVVGEAEFDNLILCQITSRRATSRRAVTITNSDFAKGGLPVTGYARPDKIFTVEPALIEVALGKLQPNKIAAVHQQLRNIFA